MRTNKETLDSRIKRIVGDATVTNIGKGGLGVIIEGGFILTAAHCVKFDTEGGMAVGDYFISDFKALGESFQASTLAIEPVSDLAVLGSLNTGDQRIKSHRAAPSQRR